MILLKCEKDFIIKLIGTKGLDSLKRYLYLNNPSTEKEVSDLISKILVVFLNKIETAEKDIVKEAFEELEFND